jgi:hypothetical protein
MAIVTTAGLVHKVTFVTVQQTRGGCAQVGPSPSDAEEFYLLTQDTEPATVREHKIAMLDALTTALGARLPVIVYHDSQSAEIFDIILTR